MSANYYMAGGKLYFKKKGATTYSPIGGAMEVKANVKAEYAEAFDHSGAVELLAKRVPKKFDGTLSFKTNDLSIEALTMAVLGTQTTGTKTDTEAGWTDKAVEQLSFGKDLLIEGAFKFVSENASGQKMVLEVYNASVSPSGDINLQSKEVAELSFEGMMLRDSSGNYADMYVEA